MLEYWTALVNEPVFHVMVLAFFVAEVAAHSLFWVMGKASSLMFGE